MADNRDLDKEIDKRIRVIDGKLIDAFKGVKSDINDIKKGVYNNSKIDKDAEKLKKELEKANEKVKVAREVAAEKKRSEKIRMKLEDEARKAQLLGETAEKYKELAKLAKKQQDEINSQYESTISNIEDKFNSSLKKLQDITKKASRDNAKDKKELISFYEEKIRELQLSRDLQLVDIEKRYAEEQVELKKKNDKIARDLNRKLNVMESKNEEFRDYISALTRTQEESFSQSLKDSEKRFAKLVKNLDNKRAEDTAVILKEISKGKKVIIKETKVKGPGFWSRLVSKFKSSKKVEKVEQPKVAVKEKEIVKTVKNKESKPLKINWLMFLAYAIPIAILLFVLYINFLPFGFEKEYIISVDENGTVHSSSSSFYLEDPNGNKITNLTDVYDYGYINAVLEPKVNLKGATVNASIEGDDVYFAAIDFNASEYDWDYHWDFTQGIPEPLEGTAQYRPDLGCVYFNASNNETLWYPNSQDMFEEGPFMVYAEWKPEDNVGNGQQIVGHYNWELWQNNDSVRFFVGRMDNSTGPQISFKYQISDLESFFNKKHYALGIYSPNNKGYIEFYLDGNFVGRQPIDDSTIWKDYNLERDLTAGWTDHNYALNNYFNGCIFNLYFSNSSWNYFNLKNSYFIFDNKKIGVLSSQPEILNISFKVYSM